LTTLTVSDIPLDAGGAAQRLRRMAAAVRVIIHWWGVHRALTSQQKEEVSAGYAADARFLTAGKKIIDVRHESFRKLTAIRTRLVSYWRGITLPYVEPGVRLIKQIDIQAFVHTMEGFRQELAEAESDLNAMYDALKLDARRRLGRLYSEADYPAEVRGLFNIEWDFPSVEPPAYLQRVSPEVYEQEQQRVARRFEEAVQLAEQAFVGEFARLVSHLSERLSGNDDGQRKVFRDSAVNNLTEFFDRFRHLNLRSSQDLDRLVEEVQGLVRGVTPQTLRGDEDLRRHVAQQMAQVQTRLEGMMVEPARRNIIRPTASRNGGPHAAGD
jgi:hypothetical protein